MYKIILQLEKLHRKVYTIRQVIHSEGSQKFGTIDREFLQEQEDIIVEGSITKQKSLTGLPDAGDIRSVRPNTQQTIVPSIQKHRSLFKCGQDGPCGKVNSISKVIFRLTSVLLLFLQNSKRDKSHMKTELSVFAFFTLVMMLESVNAVTEMQNDVGMYWLDGDKTTWV